MVLNKNSKKATESSILGHPINIHYRYKNGVGRSHRRHQAHGYSREVRRLLRQQQGDEAGRRGTRLSLRVVFLKVACNLAPISDSGC